MAQFHMSVQAISRSKGRSATAAAAYRAAARIVDQRTGEIHDFRRKRGVLAASLVLPGGAAPNRSEFWSAVELHHKRKDATVAREFTLALPHEMSATERQRLAFDYGRELADRYGVAVDVALHEPDKRGDDRNYHAHVLMSACHVAPDGTLGRKAMELDPNDCAHRKMENFAERERPRWADLHNERMAENGFSERVDHRSFEMQGIDRTPSTHRGPTATAYERKTGKPSRRRRDAAHPVPQSPFHRRRHDSSQSHPRRTRPGPPPGTRRGLRPLSAIPMARSANRSPMLLPGDVRHFLEHVGSESDSGLRWISAELTLTEIAIRLHSARTHLIDLEITNHEEEKMATAHEFAQSTEQQANEFQDHQGGARTERDLRHTWVAREVGPEIRGTTASQRVAFSKNRDDRNGSSETLHYDVYLGDKLVAHVEASGDFFQIECADPGLAAELALEHALKHGWDAGYVHGNDAFRSAVIRHANASDPPFAVFDRATGEALNDAARSRAQHSFDAAQLDESDEQFDSEQYGQSPRG